MHIPAQDKIAFFSDFLNKSKWFKPQTEGKPLQLDKGKIIFSPNVNTIPAAIEKEAWRITGRKEMVAKAQATKSARKLPEEERDAIFKKLMDSIENGVFDSQYITHKAAGNF